METPLVPLEISYAQVVTPRLLHVGIHPPHTFHFLPGQYLVLGDHAYAIASSPEKRPVELFIRISETNPSIQDIHQGDKIENWALGGAGLQIPPQATRIRFFATGTAVAAYRSFLLSSKFQKSNLQAELVAGFRNEDDLLMLDGLDQIPRVQLQPLLSQPSANWTGPSLRVSQHLRSLPAQFFREPSAYSVCGHRPFVEEALLLLQKHHIHPEMIIAPN